METKVLRYTHVRPQRIYNIHHSFSKRLFDIIFSSAVLIIFSPLYLAIMIGIRLSSPGSPLFIQPRLGAGGKVFKCYKFRTMYSDAEKRLRTLLAENPELKAEWEENQKLKNDPRIFSLGKTLRRTSLDELPQFWNVLMGDLSVVGPRPYMITQRKALGEQLYTILSVKPGITGLWQTSGRSHTNFQQRISLDASYVEIHSFFFDLFLVFKTIVQMLFSKNAY